MRKSKTDEELEGARQLVRRVNDSPPSRQQMAAYAKACSELPPGDQNFEVHAITWSILYPRDRKHGESAFFRMEALARTITGETPLSGWTTPLSEDGRTLTLQTLFEAAADEPVILVDGEPMFNRAALIQRAFQLAKIRGGA